MILRTLASLAAVTGLALAPLTSDARVLIVPDCGGGRHMLLVPGQTDDEGSPCAKACHAMTDRRNRSPEAKKNCC